MYFFLNSMLLFKLFYTKFICATCVKWIINVDWQIFDLLRMQLLMLLKQNQFGDEPCSWFQWCILQHPKVCHSTEISFCTYTACTHTYSHNCICGSYLHNHFFLQHHMLLMKCVKLNTGLRFDHLKVFHNKSSTKLPVLSSPPPISFHLLLPPHTVSPRGGYETPLPWLNTIYHEGLYPLQHFKASLQALPFSVLPAAIRPPIHKKQRTVDQ